MAIWDGWGSWGGGSSHLLLANESPRARRRRTREARRRADREPAVLETVPKMAIHRDPRGGGAFRHYYLFTGPVGAIPAVSVGGWRQTPSIWWPDDRAWVVVTEVDADSTCVGGTPEVVRRVLDDDRLEALPSDPRHRFDRDGTR